MLKNSEVCALYKQVLALVSSAQTLYIFPTGLKPIFKFFLMSRNAKYFIISLNNHSTLTRTLLIWELNSSCNELRLSRKELVNGLVRGRPDHHINKQVLDLVFVHVVVIDLVNQNGKAYYYRAFYLRAGQKSYL